MPRLDIMKKALAISVLAVALVAVSKPALVCADGEHYKMPLRGPSNTLTPPSQPLVWGDINVIHTTDTHGWLLGHQKSTPPEPNYRFVFRTLANFKY
jgi:2',3'-cyclic-nucleotide 2'-phosphodiesterase (5'-nucleotidase family)